MNKSQGKTSHLKRISQRLGLLVLVGLPLMACRRESTQVVVESGPLPRQVGEKTSYAEVISNIAPSVVSVYSRRAIAAHRSSLARAHSRSTPATDLDPGLPPNHPRILEVVGCGVIVTTNGYILTNSHVVDDAEEVTVTTATGKQLSARIKGSDPGTDIALLKVDGVQFPAAVLGDSSQLRVGDIVLAIGNPFGMGQAVTSGIVSATERTGFGLTDYEDYIQTDASINPGNSGGALTDARGRVVGINTAILSSRGGFEGISFAVPINLARDVMQQIIAQGRVIRGYLGVRLVPVPSELGKALQIPEGQGALVAQVMPRSPAAHAGLQQGDIVMAVNEQPVNDSRRLRLFIAQHSPGTQLRLHVARLGGRKALTVRLAEQAD